MSAITAPISSTVNTTEPSEKAKLVLKGSYASKSRSCKVVPTEQQEHEEPRSDERKSANDEESTTNSRSPFLPEVLQKNIPCLYKKKLIPVDMSFGTVRDDVDEEMTFRQAHKRVSQQQMAKASVCFVVKRPGCVLCKEQGHALTQMLSKFSGQQVAPWAVVKETGVDDEGLLDLYQQAFRFPFFKDANMHVYQALGDRRVGIIANPCKIAARYIEIRRRLKEKKIQGNIIGDGEGMVLGGVIILDGKGNVRYAHQEQFSRELPIDEIQSALSQVLVEEKLRQTSMKG